MTGNGVPETLGEEPIQVSIDKIRDQARAYLAARYGDSVWFRAPETFGPFEQWVWALASGKYEMAERLMGDITTHFREERQ